MRQILRTRREDQQKCDGKCAHDSSQLCLALLPRPLVSAMSCY